MIEAKLSEISAKYSMYVIGCYFKYIGDRIYNTATIFDRVGKICGQYCKVQLPPDEKWQISEGNSLDVFNHAGKSSIIDYWGQVLADAAFYRDVIVFKEIDLDEKKVQPEWYNPAVMSGTAEMRKRHLMERRPELYTTICSPLKERFTMPERDEQLSIMEKIKTGKCHW